MSIIRRRAVTVLAACLAAALLGTGVVPHPTRADDPNVDEAIDEQARLEAALAAQRAQLAAFRDEQASLSASLQQLVMDLDAVGLEIDAARRELERLTNLLGVARRDLQRYRVQIENLEADLVTLSTEIGDARLALADREALLQDHLRAAYEHSQTSLLEILLSAESLGRASSELTFMLTLSEEDELLAQEIRAERERLQIRRSTLREGRQTLTDLRDAEAEHVAALDAQQRELDATRAALEEKEAVLYELQEEQRAQLAAAKLNERSTAQLIAEQERDLALQRSLVERLKEEADKLDIAYHGRFAWPERGDFMITQEFGHTAYSWSHTGLDMSYHTPHCGGPIYAAGDGVVLADDRPNVAYGDTAIGVVIGHSQRLQSWYWHLSRELVSVGQEVSAGDLIGYEGATGIATGCHLHFQVMLDETPRNPRDYLP